MSFWDTFDWNKAAQSQFAPPHIPGNAQSDAALAQWNAQRPQITPEVLEASRGLPSTSTGAPANLSAAQVEVLRRGGQSVPQPVAGSGLNRGFVDPLALKAMAQNLPYDLDARRNAIAAQLTLQSETPTPGLTSTGATPTRTQQLQALSTDVLRSLAARGDGDAASVLAGRGG